MKTQRHLPGIFAAMLFCLISVCALEVSAQQPPPSDCCTPEATARLAETAKTISIADVSLGMSPEEALTALKAVNSNFKINVLRLDANWDCLAMITQNCMVDPKKHWLTGLDAQTPRAEASEKFQVQFTSPPSKPFIFNMYRQVEFAKQTMPTVQNVMAGLRKKYGPESVHPIDSGELLIWIFDEQGHALEGQEAKRIHDNPNCHAQPGRPYRI